MNQTNSIKLAQSSEITLIEMAKRRFADDWNKDVDLPFFTSIARAKIHDLRSESLESPDHPSKAHHWSDDRTLKANRIAWLCTNSQAKSLVPSFGIHLIGLNITGILNCEHSQTNFRVWIEHSNFIDTIDLQFAHLESFSLGGSICKDIHADGIITNGSVYFDRGFTAYGPVNLNRATIGGQLDCRAGRFLHNAEKEFAFNATSIKVQSNVFLNDEFEAQGPVKIRQAKIGGRLDCSNARFLYNQEFGFALDARSVDVEESIYLREGFECHGRVNLIRATVEKRLDCTGGKFLYSAPKGCALNASATNIKASVFLRAGFEAHGGVNFIRSNIGGRLMCTGGIFLKGDSDREAFNLDESAISESVFLNHGFEADGEVDLCNASIGGKLDCENAQFINEDKNGFSLQANALTVTLDVFFINGFKAVGQVCLKDASIGGGLFCADARFLYVYRHGETLNADGIKIGTDVSLSGGFEAYGELHFQSATIKGTLFIGDIKAHSTMVLNLRQATIGTLADQYGTENGWESFGRLDLHGLTYNFIDKQAPVSAEMRIRWINCQSDRTFDPQPYEQLASVLRRMGHIEDAIDINIEKERKRAETYQLQKPEGMKDTFFWRFHCFWNTLYEKVVYFGYRPFRRTLPGFVALLVLGWGLYHYAYAHNIIAPTSPSSDLLEYHGAHWEKDELYPSFESFFYSADCLIPLIQFGQSQYWHPNPFVNCTVNLGFMDLNMGFVVLWFQYFQIITGWILTTFIVYGIAGLVRKNDG